MRQELPNTKYLDLQILMEEQRRKIYSEALLSARHGGTTFRF
jgi:hypothetical protein